MFGAHRVPCQSDGIAVLEKERFLPQQADGEQVGDDSVPAARQFGLPQQVARILRPATKREEHLVQVGRERGFIDPKRFDGARDLIARVLGSLGHDAGKAADAHDFGGQIVGRIGAPGRPCGAPGDGWPQGLTLVEIASRPCRKAVSDDGRPVGAARFGGQFCDRLERGWLGLIDLSGDDQAVDPLRLFGMGRRCKGRL